jgi:transposase
MRKIKFLQSERETLEEGFKNHGKAHVRKRFHTLLLNDSGWSIKDLSLLYKVRTRTIYSWMNKWEKEGLVGLFIRSGRGVKATLNILDEEVVKEVKKKH